MGSLKGIDCFSFSAKMNSRLLLASRSSFISSRRRFNMKDFINCLESHGTNKAECQYWHRINLTLMPVLAAISIFSMHVHRPNQFIVIHGIQLHGSIFKSPRCLSKEEKTGFTIQLITSLPDVDMRTAETMEFTTLTQNITRQ